MEEILQSEHLTSFTFLVLAVLSWIGADRIGAASNKIYSDFKVALGLLYKTRTAKIDTVTIDAYKTQIKAILQGLLVKLEAERVLIFKIDEKNIEWQAVFERVKDGVELLSYDEFSINIKLFESEFEQFKQQGKFDINDTQNNKSEFSKFIKNETGTRSFYVFEIDEKHALTISFKDIHTLTQTAENNIENKLNNLRDTLERL